MGILDRFVALDLETTGTDPKRDEIIEITALHIREGQPAEEFHTLVRPHRKLSPVIERLTGISADQLRGQPRIGEVLPRLFSFVDGLPVIAHNAPFIAGFLSSADANAALPPLYDTLELSRIALPRLQNHRLGTLLTAFGIHAHESHRAQADVHALAQLFRALVESLAARPFRQLETLCALAEEARPPEPPLGSIAVLLREIAEYAARQGPATVKPPRIAPEVLVSLPNVLGSFEEERRVPEAEYAPVDPDVVEAFLGPEGPLAEAMERYEVRPSQIEMARAVCRALNDGELLVCEAGTGTGKSLAYLVPAILWAVANGRRVIVSTHTKNLQEQLFYKDLPLLARTLGVPFRAALLKGRNNYLCLNRWQAGKVPGHAITTEWERRAALPIVTWLAETSSGDISENVGFHLSGPGRSLWAKLSAEGQPCTPAACPLYNECFLMRIRRAAQEAHVVVVNHSLLFSDLAAERAILGEYEELIIDEAHNLERVATQYLGAELSWWTVRDLAGRIHAEEGRTESGLLARINEALPKSALRQDDVKTFQMQTARAIEANAAFRERGRAFFDRLAEVLPQPKRGEFAHKERYTPEDIPFGDAMEARDALLAAMETLGKELSTLAEWLRETGSNKIPSCEEFVTDLENRIADAEALADLMLNMTEAMDEAYVYWYELPPENTGREVYLRAAPLNVGEQLEAMFYPALRCAVMTSATLAVAGKFTYFLDRVGLNGIEAERVRTLAVGSPFNYDEQVLVAVPGWFPNPRDTARFQDAVVELVREAVLRVRRGTLVLFTAYRMLNETYRAVRDEFTSHGILLLGQGIDGSRTSLAELFRRERESVLFGTESFWQGIDIPGEALEMLIITKLPFAVPTEPLLIAQSEELRRAGKDPFLHMTVPEAAIRFRQGFGRLIRSRSDRGAVLILDTRVITERFGRAFLRSLPTRHRVFKTPGGLLDALEQWFEEKRGTYEA